MGYAEYCRKSLTSVNLHTHLTMTCGYTMSGEDFEVSLDIKMCRENPSIVFGIKIGNNVDWEETFTDSAVKVAIPGLSGVYLSVKLEDKPGREKVFLEVWLKYLPNPVSTKTQTPTFIQRRKMTSKQRSRFFRRWINVGVWSKWKHRIQRCDLTLKQRRFFQPINNVKTTKNNHKKNKKTSLKMSNYSSKYS